MSLDGLLSLPKDVNPYNLVIKEIETNFIHRAPVKGFHARILFQIGLLSLCLLLAIIYLSLFIIQGIRNNTRSYWFFRLATQKPGTYIVTNTRFVFALLNIILGTIHLGEAVNYYHIYILKKHEEQFMVWTLFEGVFLSLLLWVCIFGLVQSYVLVTNHHNVYSIPSVLVNSCFIGGIVIFPLLSSVIAIFACVYFARIVTNRAQMLTILKRKSATWMPGDNMLSDLSSLMEIQEISKRLLVVEGYHHKWLKAYFVSVTAIAIVVTLLGFFCLGLARLLRQNIREKLNRLRDNISVTSVSKHTFLSNASTFRTKTIQKSGFFARLQSKLTFSEEIKEIKAQPSSQISGSIDKQLASITDLQRTTFEITMVCGLVSLSGSAGSAITVVSVILSFRPRGLLDMSWSIFELCGLSIVWIYSVSATLIVIKMIWNLLHPIDGVGGGDFIVEDPQASRRGLPNCPKDTPIQVCRIKLDEKEDTPQIPFGHYYTDMNTINSLNMYDSMDIESAGHHVVVHSKQNVVTE